MRQREAERRDGTVEQPGFTADTIERIIRQDPIVTVSRIDKYGLPWFDYDLVCDGGRTEEHSLAISDDDSWVYAE